MSFRRNRRQKLFVDMGLNCVTLNNEGQEHQGNAQQSPQRLAVDNSHRV
jgi:hypothetical protein